MQYDFNSWLIMYVFLLFPTTPQNFTRHFYRTIDFWLLHLHTIYLEEVEMIHNIMSSFFNDVLLNNVILGFLCLTAWAWFWLQALLLLLLKPQNVHFAWWPILTGIDILLLLIVIWFIGSYCICSLLFSAEVIYVLNKKDQDYKKTIIIPRKVTSSQCWIGLQWRWWRGADKFNHYKLFILFLSSS